MIAKNRRRRFDFARDDHVVERLRGYRMHRQILRAQLLEILFAFGSEHRADGSRSRVRCDERHSAFQRRIQ